MDLNQALQESKMAIDFFFNNKFEEARQLMSPHCKTSIYHSVGHSVFLFLEAMLTFEHRHIEAASDALKQCLHVCNKFRKKSTISESIGKTFKKTNFESYTEIEIHGKHYLNDFVISHSTLTLL
jgi:hypothetical protein